MVFAIEILKENGKIQSSFQVSSNKRGRTVILLKLNHKTLKLEEFCAWKLWLADLSDHTFQKNICKTKSKYTQQSRTHEKKQSAQSTLCMTSNSAEFFITGNLKKGTNLIQLFPQVLSQPCKEKVGPGQGCGLENYPNAPLKTANIQGEISTQERKTSKYMDTSKGVGSFGKEDRQPSFPKRTEVI